MPSELTVFFRLRFAVALALAAALLPALGAADAAQAQDEPASEYIVQMKDGSTPAKGRELVADLGGQVTSPDLPVINGFGAMLENEAAEKLAARRGVAAVTPNAVTNAGGNSAQSGAARCPEVRTRKRPRPRSRNRAGAHRRSPGSAIVRLGQPLHATIGVHRAWLRGIGGSGVGVAVLDTGVAGDLPSFMDGEESRVTASVVTNPCASDADDHVGHGTHVAGLIAGDGLGESGSLSGRYMGVAPRANLISVEVSDDAGDATVLDVIYGSSSWSTTGRSSASAS